MNKLSLRTAAIVLALIAVPALAAGGNHHHSMSNSGASTYRTCRFSNPPPHSIHRYHVLGRPFVLPCVFLTRGPEGPLVK